MRPYASNGAKRIDDDDDELGVILKKQKPEQRTLLAYNKIHCARWSTMALWHYLCFLFVYGDIKISTYSIFDKFNLDN